MGADMQLYDSVVDITEDYLGPAAQRFIDRQIESHLQKTPESLTSKDLEKLIDWSSLALAHLTDNANIIREFTDNMKKLAKQQEQAA
jgi:hypothetical protein